MLIALLNVYVYFLMSKGDGSMSGLSAAEQESDDEQNGRLRGVVQEISELQKVYRDRWDERQRQLTKPIIIPDIDIGEDDVEEEEQVVELSKTTNNNNNNNNDKKNQNVAAVTTTTQQQSSLQQLLLLDKRELFSEAELETLRARCMPHGSDDGITDFDQFTLLVYLPNYPYYGKSNYMERVCSVEDVLNVYEYDPVPLREPVLPVYRTNREECVEIADVLVFDLRSYFNSPVDVAQPRSERARRQTWVATSEEATAWSGLKVDDAATANAFDHFLVQQTGHFTAWHRAMSRMQLEISRKENGEFVPYAERERDVLLMISNCYSKSERESFLPEFIKRIDERGKLRVDSLGQCWSRGSYPDSFQKKSNRFDRDWREGKQQLLRHYKFEIIIANSLCDNYVDEKLTYALQGGAIPIFLGPPNAREYEPSRVTPSIVHVGDFEYVDELIDYIEMIDANPPLAASFHAWRADPPEYWPAWNTDWSRFDCKAARKRGSRAKAPPVSCGGSWRNYIKMNRTESSDAQDQFELEEFGKKLLSNMLNIQQ